MRIDMIMLIMINIRMLVMTVIMIEEKKKEKKSEVAEAKTQGFILRQTGYLSLLKINSQNIFYTITMSKLILHARVSKKNLRACQDSNLESSDP